MQSLPLMTKILGEDKPSVFENDFGKQSDFQTVFFIFYTLQESVQYLQD